MKKDILKEAAKACGELEFQEEFMRKYARFSASGALAAKMAFDTDNARDLQLAVLGFMMMGYQLRALEEKEPKH